MDGVAPEAKPKFVKKKFLGEADKDNFIYMFLIKLKEILKNQGEPPLAPPLCGTMYI